MKVGFNWRLNVRCKSCSHVFDFQHDPANVTFPRKDMSVARARCHYCHNTRQYNKDEWFNAYDNKDIIIEEQKKDLIKMAVAIEKLQNEKAELEERLKKSELPPDKGVPYRG
jgi:hypothetical protein